MSNETHRQCRLRMLGASLRRAENAGHTDADYIRYCIETEYGSDSLAAVIERNQRAKDRSADCCQDRSVEGDRAVDRSAEGRPVGPVCGG